MKIVELLREDLILPELPSAAKPDVLRELSGFLSDRHEGLDREDVLRVLSEREGLSSTAVGEGIAIPHGKLDSARQLCACLARARKGIEWGAIDGRRIHFFFVLIAPREATGTHLKALARISLLFKDAPFRARLLSAETAHDMHRILSGRDAEY